MDFGYRCTPKLSDTVWFFGCSFTWGQGCGLEESLPYQLQKNTGLEVDNLGICGGSPDLIFFQIQQHLLSYQPRLVIIQWPPDTRTFSIKKNKIIALGSWITEPNHQGFTISPYEIVHDLKLIDSYKKNIVNGNIEHNNKQCREKVHTLLKCPLITFDYYDYGLPLDLVSDGLHPGPKSHKRVAENLCRRPELISIQKSTQPSHTQ